ncbi:MAG: quinone oxidoreductase [Ectothiorhodospiraceae bacterium]|jgi:NADPH2:quinone reductase|nr:quinone oxidoreductase [Ectothiorhodospiraceae bacterium]
MTAAASTCKAIRVHEHGGPEALRWEDVAIDAPKSGEVRIRHTAIGLNFIDVYFRSGLYPPPALPFTPGLEAAGVIESVGKDVDGLRIGDRVAYASEPLGAYAQVRNLPAARAVRLPDWLDDRQAAAMMLKGMTAEYLLCRTRPVRAGDTILVHAAAGGVGLILCQWAAHLGATVIGTVGTDEKAAIARENGCHHPLVYTREDVVQRVREITDGKGVAVVYDSVGRDTFEISLDCLRPRGMLVSFGQSSGRIPPFDIGLLSRKGSLFLTRPTLLDYNREREDLVRSVHALFEVVKSGAVHIRIGREYPLAEASQAHRDAEARLTTGSTLLLP